MKGGARNYMETQGGDTSLKIDRENFDTAVFNKIYEENRIGEAFDTGYGDWMSQSAVKDVSQKRMFNGEFNSEMFNHEFEKYKREQAQKQGSQMVQYQDPEVSISMKNKDSLMVLGQGKVSDFSGEAGNLGFRDYKDAFTNTTLIDTTSVSIEDRKSSVKGLERERSNISYRMVLLIKEDKQNKKWNKKELNNSDYKDYKFMINKVLICMKEFINDYSIKNLHYYLLWDYYDLYYSQNRVVL